jgi:splicing factor 3B subunit 3
MYALTVQPPTATQEAVVGDFIGNGKQQILIACGSRLSIIDVSRDVKGFQEIFAQDTFGILRHVAKFRLAGGTKGASACTIAKARLVIFEGTTRPSNLPLYQRALDTWVAVEHHG